MTTTTRLTILQRVAPIIGGYQGDIDSGTATTVVLDGLVGATTDDELNDDLLVMPDAATAADQTRIITDWAGATGTATIGTRSDTTYTSETYFTIPKNTWTLQEMRQAVTRSMAITRRTYRYVLPTRDYERQYQLVALSWLRHRRDVDGVFYRPSPGLLHNEDFSYWDAGTTSQPDGWSLVGSGASVARQTTFASYGSYEAALTRATNDASLVQDVPYQLAKQLIDAGAEIALKVRCTATVASRVRVGINNGVDTEWSDYHSGDGEPEDLEVSRTLTAAASRVRAVCSVDTGDTTGSFDEAFMAEGGSIGDGDWRAGSSGHIEQDVSHQLLNIGNGVPVLSLPAAYSRGAQFVIVTRRPYADLATDAASTEAPSDVIEARVVYELAKLMKPSQDRARMEQLMVDYGAKWADLAAGLIDKPVQRAQTTVLVRGA